MHFNILFTLNTYISHMQYQVKKLTSIFFIVKSSCCVGSVHILKLHANKKYSSMLAIVNILKCRF